MTTIDVFFRFLHILGAIVGLGGIVAALVVLPNLRDAATRNFIARQIGKWIGIALTVCVIAGGYNLVHDLHLHTAPAYLNTLWVKVILGLIVFVLALLVFHPAKAFAAFRAKQMMWLGILVVLGMVVVALGAELHSYYVPADGRLSHLVQDGMPPL